MKKKLLSVVLAVAVAFTFSFAMVGTASADTYDGLYFNIEKVTWSADYDSATAVVEVNPIIDGVTKTDPQHYEKRTVTFTKETTSKYNTYTFFGTEVRLAVVEYAYNNVTWKPYDNGIKQHVLKVKDAKGDDYASDRVDWNDNVYKQDVFDITDYANSFEFVNSAVVNSTAVSNAVVDGATVDAGNYSAWYATKDDEAGSWCANPAVIKSTKFVKNGEYGVPFEMTTDMYSIEYPAYEAYETDADKTTKELQATITAKEFTNVNYPDLVFASTQITKTFYAASEKANAYYTQCSVAGVADEDWTKATTNGTDEDKEVSAFTYDGKSHAVGIAHSSNGTKVTYASDSIAYGTTKAGEVDVTGLKKGFASDDYAAEAPELTNAGVYRIGVGVEVEATEQIVYNEQTIVVFPKNVQAYFGQKSIEVYEGDDIAAELDKILIVDDLCEGDDLNASYHQIPTAVGVGTVTITFDNDNYVINGPKSIEVTVKEKAAEPVVQEENEVNFDKINYTIKKGKTAAIEATATYGTDTITFQKKKGTSKITVSKAGKIKVAKSAKKGTYTVKVKAKVLGTDTYKSASETVNLKIKVK